MSLRQLELTPSWESGSPFSWLRVLESKASYLVPTHSIIHSSICSPAHPSIHPSTDSSTHSFTHPSIHLPTPCSQISVISWALCQTRGAPVWPFCITHMSSLRLLFCFRASAICWVPTGPMEFFCRLKERGPSVKLATGVPRPRTVSVKFTAAWGRGLQERIVSILGLLPKCC